MAKIETLIAYLRLSSEDQHMKSSGQAESHSIGNQRSIIQEYLKNSDELKNCTVIELIDDGYSGTNFDRPAITKALAMLRGREAQGIIVKDLSRFGRNYIDVCNYLEQVFPFLDIRFISVNDGYDSSDPACVGSMVTVFKTMFADLYSKDLSVKIKSALNHKAMQGKFLSASAPYGYAKTATDLNTLEIDEGAAEVIRYIFRSFVSGMNKNQIARELNKQGVPTPMQYKEQLGYTQGWERMVKGDRPLWTGYTVLKILQDRRYIGTVVYGKKRKISFHQKRQVAIKKADWIVAADMHEALISKELFQKAQSLISALLVGETQIPKSLLERKVECAVCGRTLTLVRGKKPFYYCKTRQYTDEFPCTSLHLPVSDVYDAVLSAIQSQAEFAVNAEQILLLQFQGKQSEIDAKQAEIKRYENEVSRQEVRQKELFKAFFNGKMEKTFFQQESAVITAKRSELGERLGLLAEELAMMQDNAELNNQFVKAIKPFLLIEKLSDDVVNELITSIRVYDDSTLEIVWEFSDELHLLVSMLESCTQKATEISKEKEQYSESSYVL